MSIEKVERFVTLDRTFTTLRNAEEHRADLIGEHLDRWLPAKGVVLTPKHRIILNVVLVENREQLKILLDY